MIKLSKTKTIMGMGLLVATLLSTTSISIASASAAGSHSSISAKVEKQVKERQNKKSADKRKEILNEARLALRETENALKYLDDGKQKDALKSLEKATGKLEIVLARDPKLELATVGTYTETKDLYANIDVVKDIRNKAKNALKDGRVQDARRLLDGLVSEMVVKSIHIPLGTYPSAIKTASSFIDEGNIKIAKQMLQTAINTLVVTEEIIPIPIADAELLLVEAKKLSEKKARNDEENKKLSTLLNSAKTEIEFAEALGYGSKKDFKNLYAELKEISNKTKNGKYGKGFFDKIRSYLSDATKSSQSKDNVVKSSK